MTVVWLRERDGTLLAEVEDWSVVTNPRRLRDLKVGECVLSIPLTDPCMAELLWDTPDDPAKPWKDWSDADIELALWPEGTPEVEPVGAPWWAGPIVAANMIPGRLEVRAWTQEAYIQASPVGGPLTNYLGLSAFSVDPTLDEWDTSGASGAAVTTSGPVWTDGYACVVTGNIVTSGLLPFSENGNYADIVVPFWVPSDRDDVTGIGAVELFTDDEGEFAFPDPREGAWFIVVPGSWTPGGWQLARVRVPQPAGREVLYRVTLAAEDEIRFGSPYLWRPENVGSPAGEDIGVVLSAIYDQQIDLLPGTWTRDNGTVGTDLGEPVRYLSVDHPGSIDAVRDWSVYGEGWVEEMVMHWATTRGVERSALDLTADTLSGWSYEVDSTGAATVMVGQFTLGDASDEVWVGDGLPNRLVGVVQVPDSIAPSDIPGWVTAALAKAGPVRSLTGVPAYATVPTPAGVADWNPGDWMTVTLENGPLTVTTVVKVDGVEWDPIKHRVTPTAWVVT